MLKNARKCEMKNLKCECVNNYKYEVCFRNF